jgi:hypothetical protein
MTMKFTLLVFAGLLANNAAQIDDIETLDHTGCVNILNRIKEVGITVDAAGNPTGSMLTQDEKFKNEITKSAIRLYERDCLEMSGLPDFTCPVTMHTDLDEFVRGFRSAMNRY